MTCIESNLSPCLFELSVGLTSPHLSSLSKASPLIILGFVLALSLGVPCPERRLLKLSCPSTATMSDGMAPHKTVKGRQSLTDMAADFDAVRRLQAERNAQAVSKKGSKTFDPTSQRTDSSTKASVTENFDTNLYGSNSVDKYAGYHTSLATNGDEDEDMPDSDTSRRLVGNYTASREQMNEFATGGAEEEDILLGREKSARISDRETDYQKRRFERGPLTPTRADPFAANKHAAVTDGSTYREVMQLQDLEREEERVKKVLAEKQSSGDVIEHKPTLKEEPDKENAEAGSTVEATGRKRKKRWDVASESTSTIDGEEAKKKSRWDEAPAINGTAAPTKRSRWDQAPALGGAAPTPAPSAQVAPVSFGTDINRSTFWSDEDLDAMLPSEGYTVLEPPPGYEPVRAAARKAIAAAVPQSSSIGGFMMQEPENPRSMGKQLPTEIPGVGDLQFFKAEDMQYFGKLVDGQDENAMSVDELKERKIMRLLLKVKNGTPPMRKTALRQLTDNARQFGAGSLFNQILPLLMEKSLEDQERHLLVKVIDRVLYKLDDLVRPYTHKILVVNRAVAD